MLQDLIELTLGAVILSAFYLCFIVFQAVSTLN